MKRWRVEWFPHTELSLRKMKIYLEEKTAPYVERIETKLTGVMLLEFLQKKSLHIFHLFLCANMRNCGQYILVGN